jgi:hypothetical protein
MKQTGFTTIRVKLKGYVMENWGFPFIVGFMLFLIIAAISLSAGLSSLAEVIADYAYFVLALGVILQFTGFLKNRKKGSEAV